MACVLHLPHRPTIFSLSILLFFLRNKPSLLCLLRLTSGDSHLFFSTLREHQRTFFPAVFATFSSVSLTFHLSPCLCRATLLPSVHRLFLAASLNISIWPCQLHFHLHFLHPPTPPTSPAITNHIYLCQGCGWRSTVCVLRSLCATVTTLFHPWAPPEIYGKNRHGRFSMNTARMFQRWTGKFSLFDLWGRDCLHTSAEDKHI